MYLKEHDGITNMITLPGKCGCSLSQPLFLVSCRLKQGLGFCLFWFGLGHEHNSSSYYLMNCATFSAVLH